MKGITLSNGVEMPRVGMGTYPLRGSVLTDTIFTAYQTGYRLFDTADNYYNEEDLGNSLQLLYSSTSVVHRRDLFLITKLSDELYEPGTLGGGSNKGLYFWKSSSIMQQERALQRVINDKVNHSLHCLKTEYLDLLLMHWPYPDFFEEIWFEMEKLYIEGKVRAIGVCNCRERHFRKLQKSCSIFPMVNQIESSPLNTKEELISYCQNKGVQVMIYSPLMSLRVKSCIAYKNYLKKLSAKYNKNEAQILLRFDIQRGLIPIPKSCCPERIKDNIDLFDFELLSIEMQNLLNFNEDRQYLPESKSCPGL